MDILISQYVILEVKVIVNILSKRKNLNFHKKNEKKNQ